MAVDIFTISLGIDQCFVLRGDGIVVVDSGEPNKGGVFTRTLETIGINPKGLSKVNTYWLDRFFFGS